MTNIRFKVSVEKQQLFARAYDNTIRRNLLTLIDYFASVGLLKPEAVNALKAQPNGASFADPISAFKAAVEQLTFIWRSLLPTVKISRENASALKIALPLSTRDAVIFLNAFPRGNSALRTVGYWLQSVARWAVVSQMTDTIDTTVLPYNFLDLAKLLYGFGEIKTTNARGESFVKLKSKGLKNPVDYDCMYYPAQIEANLRQYQRACGIYFYDTNLHVPQNTFCHQEKPKKVNLHADAKSASRVDSNAASDLPMLAPTTALVPMTAAYTGLDVKVATAASSQVSNEEAQKYCTFILRHIKHMIAQSGGSQQLESLKNHIAVLNGLGEAKSKSPNYVPRNWIKIYDDVLKNLRRYWDSEKYRYKFKTDMQVVKFLNTYVDSKDLKGLRTIGVLLQTLVATGPNPIVGVNYSEKTVFVLSVQCDDAPQSHVNSAMMNTSAASASAVGMFSIAVTSPDNRAAVIVKTNRFAWRS